MLFVLLTIKVVVLSVFVVRAIVAANQKAQPQRPTRLPPPLPSGYAHASGVR